MNSLLKFITCGSVDDGKSTVIGNLLYNAKLIFADQRQALELDSKVGSAGGEIDYSLLLDGLMAEREQGITIDVAYRFFNTDKRSFIVADCPGHEQYTRNMAVGASFAELAIVLVDGIKGVSLQTKRHIEICNLMGIKDFIVVVNKMDLIDYDRYKFYKIKNEIDEIIKNYEIKSFLCIPISATKSDNIISKSDNMSWYRGESLLKYLEEVDIYEISDENLIFPVQRVSRPNWNFRGFQGIIEAGEMKLNDEITVLPNKEKAVIKEIYLGSQKLTQATKGQSIMIVLNREVDISRGDVITNTSNDLKIARQFTTTIIWMDEKELIVGRNYLLKLATKTVNATVAAISYKIDINTNAHIGADSIKKNDIAVCDIIVSSPICISEIKKIKSMGRFVLIDRLTNMTSGCGIIRSISTGFNNIFHQNFEITRQLRANIKDQKPVTLWFTGLSGSGKSTIANLLEKRLFSMGKHTITLDGDNVREGLNKDLGFSNKDRIENIRRIAEVAKLMNDAGLMVLTAFISPFEDDRLNAREIIGDCFIEIYVSTPIEICEQRDVKGLYAKARNGELPDFTGVVSPYETPTSPDIVVDTSKETLEQIIDKILEYITI